MVDGCLKLFLRHVKYMGVVSMDPVTIPRVIIESPFSGDQKRNTRYAQRCMYDCLERFEAPYASHLLYTQVLDDTDPVDRKHGMEAGFAWVHVSDKTVVYTDYGMSGGMKQGVKIAKELGHPIEYREIGKNPIELEFKTVDRFMGLFAITFALVMIGLTVWLSKFVF